MPIIRSVPADLKSLIPPKAHNLIQAMSLYGSRLVGGAAVTPESDFDVLILPYDGDAGYLTGQLTNCGFTSDLKNHVFTYEGSGFWSLRRHDINLIICFDEEFYYKAKTAMRLCRDLKVYNKADRIALHDVVVRGLIDG